MNYAEACNASGKYLLHLKDRSKTDTMSLLPPEGETDTKSKPKHEGGHSPLWDSTAGARRMLKEFQRITERRSDEEMQDVWAGTVELVEEFMKERAEDRKKMRGE